MTIGAPRLNRLDLAEVNRAFQELAAACQAEVIAVAIGEWRLLEVLASETSATFFPTARRIYSVPSGVAPTTTRVRLYTSGVTIVRHSLGRKPKGYAVLGQQQSGSVTLLDVAALEAVLPLGTLGPSLNPAEYIAFRADAGLYTIAVVG